MCRFLPPPGRHHFGSPHGRYLQIFEIHWFFKKSCKKLKFWNPGGCVDFCRLRDGIISGARMAGTSRFVKFIDFSNTSAKSWNVELLMDVSNFAASGTASFPVPAWPVPSDFWNSMIFFIAKSWKFEILMDVSNCAASGKASFWVLAWRVPPIYWNSLIFPKIIFFVTIFVTTSMLTSVEPHRRAGLIHPNTRSPTSGGLLS